MVKFGKYFDLFETMPPFMKTDCEEKCGNSLRSRSEIECSLTIGGPKVYIWSAMGAYIATIIFYSSEHVVNFITWTRTSRKSAESGSRSVVAEVVAEITEQGSTDHQVRDKKISWSASGPVLKKCCNCTIICSRYTTLSDCD